MRKMAKKRLGTRARRRISPTFGGVPQGGPTPATASAVTPGGKPRRRAGTVDFELSPWVPTTANPFDAKKAAHLMRRAGFGAKPDEIDALVKIGVHRTVDLLVIPSRWGIQEFGSVMLPSGEILNLNYNVAYQRAQWIHEAATTHFPLKEKMTLFFHDHFSTGRNTSIVDPMQIPHMNIYRRHGLGEFRDVLVEVSRDPNMLYWLDNRINGAGRSRLVNENYGREVIELYTMGVNAPYTQADVYDASRCLAGWSLSYYNKFYYNRSYAIAGAGLKTILGQTIYNPTNQEQEGYQLIDLLLSRKETSEYVVGKIWTYFVNERPTTNVAEQKLWDDIIVELAKRWKAVAYDLRALMWVILSSNYFYSSRAIRKLVKNPMEYSVGAIRHLGVPPIGRYTRMGYRIEQMGLALFRYSNPSGLDDGVAWIDSQALINRSNFADDLTQVSRTADFRVQWNPMDEVNRYNLYNKKLIVDHYLKVLVDDDVSSTVRANLMWFMDYYDGTPKVYRPYASLLSNFERAGKIRSLVQLIMMLPEYNIN